MWRIFDGAGRRRKHTACGRIFFLSSVSISLTTHIKANFHVRTKTLHYDKFFVIYIVVCFFFLSRNIFSGFSHHAFVFLCPVTCVFYRYKIDWIKYTLTVFGCKCHSVIETWQRHNQRIIIFIKTSWTHSVLCTLIMYINTRLAII